MNRAVCTKSSAYACLLFSSVGSKPCCKTVTPDQPVACLEGIHQSALPAPGDDVLRPRLNFHSGCRKQLYKVALPGTRYSEILSKRRTKQKHQCYELQCTARHRHTN